MTATPPPLTERRAGALRRPRGVLRRVGEGVMALLLVATLLAAIDFLRFVGSIADTEPQTVPSGDGVVALTGGADRIPKALGLVGPSGAQRLLITGVHTTTSVASLTAASPHHAALFGCCVDVDRNALNTLGNALETVRWARANDFDSLVIVTSTYHMPRTILELNRLSPTLDLKPYPVVADGLRLDRWWTHGQTARILLGEYVKYLVARVPIRLFDPTLDAPTRAANADLD